MATGWVTEPDSGLIDLAMVMAGDISLATLSLPVLRALLRFCSSTGADSSQVLAPYWISTARGWR
jgi:hypothetical protein